MVKLNPCAASLERARVKKLEMLVKVEKQRAELGKKYKPSDRIQKKRKNVKTKSK